MRKSVVTIALNSLNGDNVLPSKDKAQVAQMIKQANVKNGALSVVYNSKKNRPGTNVHFEENVYLHPGEFRQVRTEHVFRSGGLKVKPHQRNRYVGNRSGGSKVANNRFQNGLIKLRLIRDY